jgi:hypothetical protein
VSASSMVVTIPSVAADILRTLHRPPIGVPAQTRSKLSSPGEGVCQREFPSTGDTHLVCKVSEDEEVLSITLDARPTEKARDCDSGGTWRVESDNLEKCQLAHPREQ